MGGGPPCFPRGSTCPAVLRIASEGFRISATGLLPAVAGLSRTSSPIPNLCDFHVRRPTTPFAEGKRFGLFPFRSPLLRESRLLSLPQGTKMFQFPWYAPSHPMDSGGGTGSSSRWVAPFGNPRIKACLRLPEAYRSSPRPSSAPGAKASTVRPYQLHLQAARFSSGVIATWLYIPYPIFKVRVRFFRIAVFAATKINLAQTGKTRKGFYKIFFAEHQSGRKKPQSSKTNAETAEKPETDDERSDRSGNFVQSGNCFMNDPPEDTITRRKCAKHPDRRTQMKKTSPVRDPGRADPGREIRAIERFRSPFHHLSVQRSSIHSPSGP